MQGSEHERLWAELQRRIGHRFAQPLLLRQALTHRSYSSDNNERLEFLGDALISAYVAERLYRLKPRAGEGDLSRLRASLVREGALAAMAREVDLGPLLQLGEGELKSGGWRRDSVLADALEALVAAVYLDAGGDAMRTVCATVFNAALGNLPDAESLKDPKTQLQEWLQGRSRPLPQYEVLSESGPAHRRYFSVRARLTDANVSAESSGSSRRVAEQQAARLLLERLSGVSTG
ncbi:ribonuclease III [Panacagrimonas sp.]|uniref:ribonuclease III n=1 Tax=Panacagrimonas sp. TaxID=2480088 RepID=UPI003B51AB7B